ncbi:gamma-glutamyltransferase [Rhodobacteraceae bacterium 2CG4]|uniref:Gamma-glutamyltransferase n=1 Tax=Halovulum marinum TaxID=2662447 RepID=A0A6L5YYX4_9RHOB|nr:gamma-glutamyltransferase family protein [Halovulum marinum]MSU89473.1 gamma-glutamyltransferase [Halovulum marinum]
MRDFHHPDRSPVYAVGGMAATSHPLATQEAVRLLAAGGNAVDAAIGAAVLLNICEPQSTGLGGDLFALVKPAGREEIVGLNASGRAPAGLDAARLRAEGLAAIPPTDARAVTVPGAVDGFVRLSEDYGVLGLERVLAPAIDHAERGVPVAPRVALDWRLAEDRLQGAARAQYLIGGRPPAVGDIFRAPRQAALLRRIAAEGRAAFYEGAAAAGMVAALRAAGGDHAEADFAAQACDYVAPIRGRYRGAELVELPPNGQGVTALLLAAILERHDIGRLDPFGAARVHLEAEAAKLAYDARNRFVADPATADEAVARLTDPALAERLAALIDPDRALPDPAAAAGAAHRDTVYLCVVDGDGMAVSLIYSIFNSFGSGIVDPDTGILFQNRGSGFCLEPGHPNEAGPGKRPLHTIIPAMLVEDGRVTMPFGVMGGQYQAAGHVRFLSNMLDFGMDPQQAIDAPRAFPEAGELRLEAGHAAALHPLLADKGHRVVVPRAPIGGAQAIRIDHARGVLIGASDPRKDGCALGL